MRPSQLLFLEPPYELVRRLDGATPALGSVALLDVTRGRLASGEVKAQMQLVPWCPLCLLADPDSGMRSVRRLVRTCVAFGIGDVDGAARILKAVSQRPRPTASDLAEWMTRRTHLPTLARLLADLFSRPRLGAREAAWLPHATQERLRWLGTFDADAWQRVGLLAEVAADRSLLHRVLRGGDEASVERCRDIVELLGCSVETFRDRYGWEWVLERALERAGFFDRLSPRATLLRRPCPDDLGWSTSPRDGVLMFGMAASSVGGIERAVATRASA